MSKSLKLRTLLLGFFSSTALFILFYTINYKNTLEHHNKDLITSSQKISDARSDFIAFHLWNLSHDEIKLIGKNLLKDKSFCGIRIYDENNNIYFQNGKFLNKRLFNNNLNPDNIFFITNDIHYKLGDELKKIGEANYCFSKKENIENTKNEILQSSFLIIILAILILTINFYTNNFIFVILEEFRIKLSTLAKKREKITSGNLIKYTETKPITNTFNNIIIELDNAEKDLIEKKDAAETANKAKSDFLSNMSHEMRTPMHAITNYAYMGVERLKLNQPEKIEKFLTNIITSSERLLVLINNLLDISKIESGKMEFNFVQNKISFSIERVLTELEPLFKNKNITLQNNYNTENLKLFYDSEKIHQVIINIFSNALKFSPNNSIIKINCDEFYELNNKFLKISISDKGIGIPESELDKIFDKFEQSSSTKNGSGGTGLGLSICTEIISAHKGTIWAENNNYGGATISFTLPYNLT